MFPWAHVATETLKEARARLKPFVSVQAEQNLGLKTASVRPPEANEISIFLASPLPSACQNLFSQFLSEYTSVTVTKPPDLP